MKSRSATAMTLSLLLLSGCVSFQLVDQGRPAQIVAIDEWDWCAGMLAAESRAARVGGIGRAAGGALAGADVGLVTEAASGVGGLLAAGAAVGAAIGLGVGTEIPEHCLGRRIGYRLDEDNSEGYAYMRNRQRGTGRVEYGGVSAADLRVGESVVVLEFERDGKYRNAYVVTPEEAERQLERLGGKRVRKGDNA